LEAPRERRSAADPWCATKSTPTTYGWKAAHRRRGLSIAASRGGKDRIKKKKTRFYAKIGQLTVEQDL
jgi:hypothetical protein